MAKIKRKDKIALQHIEETIDYFEALLLNNMSVNAAALIERSREALKQLS